METRLVVHKFGGSVLAGPENLASLQAVIQAETEPCVIVVSALRGVTDRLLEAARCAARGRGREAAAILQQIHAYHETTAQTILQPRARSIFERFYRRFHRSMAAMLTSMVRLREVPPASLDRWLSMGEQTASFLVHLYLRQHGQATAWCDARRFLVTDERFGRAHPLFPETRVRALETLGALLREAIIPVVPGFIGRTLTGRTTTLGRGGSDLTATLIAAVFRAQRVVLWTNVAAIMTADPAMVPTALPLSHLPYDEALILARFGVKRFHPRALGPVYHRQIPVVIRSLLQPNAPGTVIQPDADLGDGPHVIAHMPQVTDIHVFGFQTRVSPALIRNLRRWLRPLVLTVHTWPPGVRLIVEGSEVPSAVRRGLKKMGGGTLQTNTWSLVVLVGKNLDPAQYASLSSSWNARVLFMGATDRMVPVLVPIDRLDACVRHLHDHCFVPSGERG